MVSKKKPGLEWCSEPEGKASLRNADNDRLRSAFGAVGAHAMATMSYGFSADLAPSTTKPMPRLAPSDHFAVWGQGYGSWGRTESDGNASKLTRSTGGFLTGADAALFDNLRFGVIAGYIRSAFDVNARLSSGESDNYHLGLYGGGQWGALSLRTGASYSWRDIVDPKATLAFAGSNPFSVAGVPIARDAAIVEAGLDLAISKSAALGISYAGQLARDAQDHAFKANLAVRF
ncbi:MAG TPA: autotransporter domain-containing protein [Rhizobiaceae bacterium]|nr:autotransporter domain-containing protein [Rhizobiaceae bacterium]